jgi:6-phosphogluconolactonase
LSATGDQVQVFPSGQALAAAAAYERALRETYATPAGPPRFATGARFDWVLLGLGEGGHNASLFPGRGAIHERVRWVVAELDPPAPPPRITLPPRCSTPPPRWRSWLPGRDKVLTLERVLRGPSWPDLWPVQIVAPRSGRRYWLVDAEAAVELEQKGEHIER